MTSLTGKTKMTLKSTINPPGFAAATFGGIFQLVSLYAVWAIFSSAGPCLRGPISCLSDLKNADSWGRLSVLVMIFAVLGVWLPSLRPFLRGGRHSDPSIVDRLWSIQPWLYAWYFYFCAPSPNPRLLVMCVLSTLWGLRITWNFWRKGGFSGGEDHRWEEVRTWYPIGWRWEIFNFFFICLYQEAEILGFSLPAAAAMQAARPGLQTLDYVYAALFLMFLSGETIADIQMFNFQTEKYRRKNLNLDMGPYAKGFIDTGLWAWSRHPNYFCEVSIWWCYYLLGTQATGSWVNWTVLGPVYLTLLFVVPSASVDVSELLSSRKYQGYAAYQRSVPKFIPWFPASAHKAS